MFISFTLSTLESAINKYEPALDENIKYRIARAKQIVAVHLKIGGSKVIELFPEKKSAEN